VTLVHWFTVFGALNLAPEELLTNVNCLEDCEFWMFKKVSWRK
jgi:hypothetical protein